MKRVGGRSSHFCPKCQSEGPCAGRSRASAGCPSDSPFRRRAPYRRPSH
ncbi:MAG: hypothetical protein MZV64_11110 [Ignavibacteriales bacterium]|nr:hypothetical protein [Ignavibacteriales bacterium]